MRKLIYCRLLPLFFFFSFCAAACSRDNTVGITLSAEGYDLSGPDAELFLSAQEQTLVIKVHTNKKTSWKALFVDNSNSFLTLDRFNEKQTGSGSIRLEAAANLTGKSRSKALIVESGSSITRVNITQKSYDVQVDPSKKIEMPIEGGEFSVKVSVSPAVELAYRIQDKAEWISAAGSQTWKVKENDSSIWPREGFIYILEKSTSAVLDSITVWQKGVELPAITVSPSKKETLSNEAQRVSFQISSRPVVELAYETAPDADWIKPAAGEAASWDIAENKGSAREGKIYIIWQERGERIDSIVIQQQHCVNESNAPIAISIPGNTYVTAGSGVVLASDPNSTPGVSRWSQPDQVISMYFRVSKPGPLKIGFTGRQPSGSSEIKVTVNKTEFTTTMGAGSTGFYPAGQIEVEKAGYIRVDFQGISKTGAYFGEISKLRIGGEAAGGSNTYIRDSQVKEWSYWGRRGPSVHLRYEGAPADVEYFYNEIVVPEGNDVIGSYFMANGFGQGYCGIQVNSAYERRILFSVWAPFETDDPSQIPEHLRVKPLRRGEGVTIKEFGNEGSGGQSYLVYPWKAGVTYKVLTQVRYNGVVSGSNTTDYTAYFFDPEADGGSGKWFLIASFRRPETKTTYTGMHSFLENFSPEQGWISREVNFDNQWVRTLSGDWKELSKAVFTHDATADNGIRLDYFGGLRKNKFLLRNCGYFSYNIPKNSVFQRTPNGTPPDIDLEALKKIPSAE